MSIERTYDQGLLHGLETFQRMLGDDIQRAQKAWKMLGDELERLDTIHGALESMITNTFIRNHIINYGLALDKIDISKKDLMTLEQFRINLMREYG